MTPLRIFRRADFREGRWRNGLGLSWDIASAGPDPDFDWRFALARIDADVPFSDYPGVDRIFTLIDGDGLTLNISTLGDLPVAEPYVPVFFPGDAACACRLSGGPCTALNLFLRRGRRRAQVIIHETADAVTLGHAGATLLFVLEGNIHIAGNALAQGDAALLAEPQRAEPQGKVIIYEAWLLS